MYICNLQVDSALFSPTARIAVPSANVAMVLFSGSGRSLVYSRYKTGPSTLRWGTPALMSFLSEKVSSTLILNDRFFKYDSRILANCGGNKVLSL